MQQNIIWTNDTDQIDAIIDDWKQEAAHLATAMAENPKETMADATYGVDVILEKAWKYVVGECELPAPAATRRSHRIHRRIRCERPYRRGRPQH